MKSTTFGKKMLALGMVAALATTMVACGAKNNKKMDSNSPKTEQSSTKKDMEKEMKSSSTEKSTGKSSTKKSGSN